jgi:hypothetical protein
MPNDVNPHQDGTANARVDAEHDKKRTGAARWQRRSYSIQAESGLQRQVG